MYRLFSRSLIRISINLIYKWCTVYSFVFAFSDKMTNRITLTIKTVSRRLLSTISIALVLSALLSACGGGGGGGGETTPTPTPTPTPTLTPTLSVLFPSLRVDEDFPITLVIANATNATNLTVNQSTTGVITVVSTTNSVTISSFANGNGQTTLTIVAINSSGSTTAQVVVAVIAINDPPTLIVSSNSISTVGGFSPITINTTASDVEDANLTFTVSESTTGVVRVTQSANAIVLNTIAGASGQTTLTVSVVDSSGTTVTQTIVVNVAVTAGVAPVLMVSTNRINVQEDFSSVVIRTTASDSDSATLTLTVTPSMRLVNVAISTRTNDLSIITLTAIANLNGTTTLTFRATDDGGQTNSTEIVVVVVAVNDPPTITIPTPTLTVLEDFDGTNSVATFADVDGGDALTVTVTESNPGVVTVTTSASGISVAAIANRNGRTTLNISVSDGTLRSTAQVVVDVTPVNDPPVLSVSTSALILAEDFGTFLIATTRSDVDGDTLTLTVSESATGIVSVSTSSAGVQLRSTNNISGVTTLTITLSDDSISTSTQVSVIVTAVNDAPTLDVSTTALTLNEDFTMVLIATTRTDIDSNTLTLTVTESTTGVVTVTVTDAGVRVSNIANANGRTTLTISISDGTLSDSAQVVVTVNDPPTISVSTTALTLFEDFTTIVPITVTDIENDTLTLTVTESTTGIIKVTTSASGFQVESIANMNGRVTLIISGNDGTRSASALVVVTVIAVNDPPTLSVSTNSIVRIGSFSPITINTSATDIEDGVLPFSVQASSLGVVRVTTSANAIVLYGTASTSGRTTLTVKTVDNFGTTMTELIAVDVTVLISAPPILTVSTNLIQVTEDFMGSVVIRTTATDADGDIPTLTLSESSRIVDAVISTLTNGMSTITLTSIANLNGTATLTVRATDVGGLTTTTEIVLELTSVNDTPTLIVSTDNISTFGGFLPIVIGTTATDDDDSTLAFSVQVSTTDVVRVTTSANAIILNTIFNIVGQTTLTISATDPFGSTAVQIIPIKVTIVPSALPVLTLSTTFISVQEDFTSPVVIRANATDADGTTVTLIVIESTRLVNVAMSAQANNETLISLTPIANLNGTVTLTVHAVDPGGLSTSQRIVVLVNAVSDAIPFTLSTSVVSMTAIDSQLKSNVHRVNILNGETRRAQFTVTSSGSPLFSANPTPVVSFTTNAINTASTLTSTANMAQLYFTIAPNRTGTATLTVQLTNLITSDMTEQTMVVHVNSVDVSPGIAQASTNIQNLIVHGGHLYANSVSPTTQGVSRFLTTASALGGHLININTIEEINFVRATTSGLTSQNAWLGLVLPQQTFPGELFWITNNSTIAYGYASDNGINNLRLYPGHIALDWHPGTGLVANRTASTSTAFNWATYSFNANTYFLIEDIGDTNNRPALYEFPQGLPSSSIVTAGSVNTIRLTGFDLNGDAISTANWSGMDPIGGTVNFRNIYQSSGVQTVDMVYTAPPNFEGQTTVVVTLQTNGLSTTTAFSFRLTVPVFTLPTTSIVLIEHSSQTIRNEQLISNVRIPAFNGTQNTLNLQWRVTHSGDAIFSTNPAPVVSFTTNALVTSTRIGSTPQSAQLYFSIAPDQTGTATLTVQLLNSTDPGVSQQTVVVQVDPVTMPPVIAQVNTSIENLVVHGGRLYANSVTRSPAVTPFLQEARALGGHLININTVEEFNFVRSTTGGLTSHNAWYGMALAQQTFPGELFWITNDSTMVYGFATTNGVTNLRVYPGHYALNWHSGAGLNAHRRAATSTVFNWTVYSEPPTDSFFLLDDGGDTTSRPALYEFPQGLAPATDITLTVGVGSNTVLGLTGFDLDGDTINIANWSATATFGTANISSLSQSSGLQAVGLVYTAPANFEGQTTVVVSLQVNGLNTSTTIAFTVDGPPNIALSTQTITLAEDFTNFVIGTTVSDVIDGPLSFTVRASSTGVENITTTANTIEFSGASNFSGVVTLTIQATDSVQQTASTLVVITVQALNTPPTLTVSSNSITTLGGFAPISITATAIDTEDGALPISVKVSTSGVVSVNLIGNIIVLSPLETGSGQTTVTVSTVDSENATAIQTIAVNVMVSQSSAPVLMVSTNLILVDEDFDDIVIRTTATDNETSTLIVTISSLTQVVNTVFTTQGISLSSVANLNGTTTLTVRATDESGLFDSTEIVVIVQSINDTPTITISSQSVVLASMLNAAPLLLNVSVIDEEDGVLSYSISTGHTAVETVITTTSLTISRRGLGDNGLQVILTLRTTDSDGKTASTNVIVTVQSLLVLTTGTKFLDFAWSAVSGATHYQLQSDPDRTSGFTDLSTTGIVIRPNSTNINQTTAQALVALHRYIPRVNNPQYGVKTCDATSCGATFGHNEVSLTNAQLNNMVGRFQPSILGFGLFGSSVSLSDDGNTLAVGAFLEGGSARGVYITKPVTTLSIDSGAAYIFRRNGRGWSQQAYIKASNADSIDQFGESVSISADGNTFAVGARNEDSASTNGAQSDNSNVDSGAVYVFQFNSNAWTQQAYIKASNTGVGDQFGSIVSLSKDGNTLAVGAPTEDSSSTGVNAPQNNSNGDSGAVYVFRRNGNVWTQQAYIKASNPGVSDQFGWSVSLNGDGNTLAIGSIGEDGSSTSTGAGATQNNGVADSGAVYIFRFSNGNWLQQAYIKASNPGINDQFGGPVSLSRDGNTLAVGAFNEDGSSTSTGAGATQNNGAADSGAAYVFRFINGNWSQQAYIKASNTGSDDHFGMPLSLNGDGNTLAVGATEEDGSTQGVGGTPNDSATNVGATYLFEFSNGTWSQQNYIKGFVTSTGLLFGSSVSLSGDGDSLAVGAPRTIRFEGIVYLY